MKQIFCMALALALSAALLTGCGCTAPNVSTDPNGMITDPATTPTTNPMPTMTTPPEESTRETTRPTQETTSPTTGATIPGEMPGEIPGGTGDTTPTDITGQPGRARGMGPRRMP